MNPALLLLLLLDGDGEESGQSGPLVGQWSQVAYMQATATPIELIAKHIDEPLTARQQINELEATDDNNH